MRFKIEVTLWLRTGQKASFTSIITIKLKLGLSRYFETELTKIAVNFDTRM